MSVTLSGVVCVRNAFELGYSWIEAVESLLPVVDECVVCDSDSHDGTKPWLDNWARLDPKITPVNYPWTNPVNTVNWYPEWISYARQHASGSMCIYLDADEALFDEDYEKVINVRDAKGTVFFKRLNFWKDPQHLIPEGHCCGTKVLRMAPANMPVPSDYPYEPAASTMAQAVDSSIRIGHYGFLRERDKFFKKAREVQRIWVGSYDPRLEAAEKYEGEWSTMPGVTGFVDNLVPYSGSHPKAIIPWLKERGFNA